MRATRLGAILVAASGVATQAEGQYCDTIDLDQCGCVNIFDVVILFQMWGEQGGNGIADFDASGAVDGLDLAYMLAHLDLWGNLDDGCMPLPAPGEVEAFVHDVTTDDDAMEGRKRYDVTVRLADPEHVLISVHCAYAGCSEPPCFFGGFLEDSLVSIGSVEADPDPNFSLAEFEAGTGFGDGGGWWTFVAEGTHHGLAGLYENNEVRVAHLVTPEASDFAGDLRVVWRTAEQELFTDSVGFALQRGDCYADFNDDGRLNILDFVAYADAWKAMDPVADCDGCGNLNILDFVCFQSLFQEGCP